MLYYTNYFVSIWLDWLDNKKTLKAKIEKPP